MSKPVLLLFGANGKLGKAIQFCANQKDCITCIPIDGPRHGGVDVADFKAVFSVIEQASPDWVVNCAAYNDVDGAETNRAEAMVVNATAVGNMVCATKVLRPNAVFVHISTDYVFHGNALAHFDVDTYSLLHAYSYTPYEATDPVSYYGVTKLMGEKLLCGALNEYYIFRTCGLFGVGTEDVVSRLIVRLSSGQVTQAIWDQVFCPTFVNDLAYSIVHFLAERHYCVPAAILHAAGPACTPYHFMLQVAKQWCHLTNFPLTVIDELIEPVDFNSVSRRARRPRNSALIAAGNLFKTSVANVSIRGVDIFYDESESVKIIESHLSGG